MESITTRRWLSRSSPIQPAVGSSTSNHLTTLLTAGNRERRNKGVLRQSGLNLFLGNQGRWQLLEDGLVVGYTSQDQTCRDLTETSQDWRMSSVEGLSQHIRLKIEKLEMSIDAPN